MTQARPLRDVFDQLAGEQLAGAGPAGDPADALAGSGHGDLPDQLVAEAIVSYADTAPVEVAAHLAPFVTAHSPVPLADPAAAAPDPATGLNLLATAPAGPGPDHPAPADDPLPADDLAPADDPLPADDLAPADDPLPAPDVGAAGPVPESVAGAEPGTEFGAGDLSGGGASDGTVGRAGVEGDGGPFGLDFGGGEQPAGEAVSQPGLLDADPGEPEPAPTDGFAPPAPPEPEQPPADGFAPPVPPEPEEPPADPDGVLAG